MHHRRFVTFILVLAMLPMLSNPMLAQDELVHTVQAGDNLFRIALRYGVTIDDLARANNITNTSTIYAGQELIIPGLSVPDDSEVVENPLVATAPIVHTVQRGDTLRTIAALYNVSVEDILKANQIDNPDKIYPGQELNIWTPDLSTTEAVEAESTEIETTETSATESSAATGDQGILTTENDNEETTVEVEAETENSAAENITHTVQPGEHLSQIARLYNISWTAIAEANNITNPNNIYAGIELVIPVNRAVSRPTTIASTTGTPAPVVGTGREIVVDLSNSMIYAYEDGELQRTVVVSTGLPATPTVQGDFTVQRKIESQTMSGPGYYLPGVQWVMYFYRGYAIHGTYWHDNFGQPMSHGCVNLPNEEAAWFYDFATIGTPVRVQY